MTRDQAVLGLLLSGWTVLAAGCGGSGNGGATGPDEPAPGLSVEIEGRVERSLRVSLRAARDGSPVSDTDVTWSADPAYRVEFVAGDEVRLLEAGSVTFTAETADLQAARTVEVAVPPRIVFALRRSGNQDVWSVTLDGRDPRRLTSHESDDGEPTTGGGTLAFTSYRDGDAELYALDLPEGSPRRLTRTQEDEIQPALSADGTRLAFARAAADGRFQVWISSADASDPERATEGLGFGGDVEGSPSWAPDAERLALMSTAAGSADVYEVRVSDGQATVVADGDDAQVEPAWSPDGERIAFAAEAEEDTEIFVVEIATGELTRLTHRAGIDGEPAWLPDGRLVYTAWTETGPGLRWLDPSTDAPPRQITTPEGAPGAPAGTFE